MQEEMDETTKLILSDELVLYDKSFIPRELTDEELLELKKKHYKQYQTKKTPRKH